MHSHWITDSGTEAGQGVPKLIFPYWSFTKTAIAICALKLAEAGRLGLDAPLAGDYSLRQLLRHSSGLPDYGTLPTYHSEVAADAEPWPVAQLIQMTMAQGALFAPGQGWAYSNLGYLFARQQIEAASGLGLAELIDQIICQPLDLTAQLATTRAQFSKVCWPGAKRYHPAWVYHGCLIGTARDAALLLRGLCAGDLLQPASLAQMQDLYPLGKAIAGRPWITHGYGLGLMIGTTAAGRTIGHSGGGPFSSNAVYHFPDAPQPLTVACFHDAPGEAMAETQAVALALQA
jgi:D-alanyl-D-alanine carboxypeptidase